MAFKFEKLRVWQESLEFDTNIHFLTRKFPKEEMFSLTSQIKRAVGSIFLNIAEGPTRQTNNFSSFLATPFDQELKLLSVSI
ncbi:MAG: four helix bundle protein [Saprospiraceae bacterium]|jgi:four helix bundle protein